MGSVCCNRRWSGEQPGDAQADADAASEDPFATALGELRDYSNDAHVMDIQLNYDLVAFRLSTYRCQREMRRNIEAIRDGFDF